MHARTRKYLKEVKYINTGEVFGLQERLNRGGNYMGKKPNRYEPRQLQAKGDIF
jgi:hypothetical protein